MSDPVTPTPPEDEFKDLIRESERVNWPECETITLPCKYIKFCSTGYHLCKLLLTPEAKKEQKKDPNNDYELKEISARLDGKSIYFVCQGVLFPGNAREIHNQKRAVPKICPLGYDYKTASEKCEVLNKHLVLGCSLTKIKTIWYENEINRKIQALLKEVTQHQEAEK